MTDQLITLRIIPPADTGLILVPENILVCDPAEEYEKEQSPPETPDFLGAQGLCNQLILSAPTGEGTLLALKNVA